MSKNDNQQKKQNLIWVKVRNIRNIKEENEIQQKQTA